MSASQIVKHKSIDALQWPLSNARRRTIRLWLLVTALLVFVLVTIGGATRLTGSGLSITEWRPVSGAIPPLGAESWLREFDNYKLIPQYRLQNSGITLEEFKTLFWWEWGHRELARLIGLVFGLGFLTFLVLGWIRGRFIAIIASIGLLLALQGLAGWLMVYSGLQEGMVAVEPVKLAIHLVLACLFFASLVWMIARLTAAGSSDPDSQTRLKTESKLLIVTIFLQIALGALVAGNKAGLIYNTWPSIDGAFIPAVQNLFFFDPWWLNLLNNHLTVQFDHRMCAYLLLIAVILHAFDARHLTGRSEATLRASHLAVLVAFQAMIGILTLLFSVPLWAGLLHQAAAVAILGFAVWHASRFAA